MPTDLEADDRQQDMGVVESLLVGPHPGQVHPRDEPPAGSGELVEVDCLLEELRRVVESPPGLGDHGELRQRFGLAKEVASLKAS